MARKLRRNKLETANKAKRHPDAGNSFGEFGEDAILEDEVNCAEPREITVLAAHETLELQITPWLIDSLVQFMSSTLVPDAELHPYSGLADWHFEALADRFQRSDPRFKPKYHARGGDGPIANGGTASEGPSHKREFHAILAGGPAIAVRLAHDITAWGGLPLGVRSACAPPPHDIFLTYCKVDQLQLHHSRVGSLKKQEAKGGSEGTWKEAPKHAPILTGTLTLTLILILM